MAKSGARPHLRKIAELADRMFCIYSEQAPAKGHMKARGEDARSAGYFGGIPIRWS
jgi:hypothetical protein